LIEPIDNPVNLLDFLSYTVVWHFVNAQPKICGVHEILGITQYRDCRRLERVQNTFEHCQALGVFSRAVCHNGDRAVEFGEEQEFGNEPGCRIDIECRGEKWNQNAVGIMGQLAYLSAIEGGGCVDDNRSRIF